MINFVAASIFGSNALNTSLSALATIPALLATFAALALAISDLNL